MDLRLLRYFVAVAEEQTFARAARRLHISQPPLTRQIKALEDELGVRLFDRTTRNVSLTVAGRALLPKAQEALESADRFRQDAHRLREGVIGSLRIACVTSALYDVLPTAIRHFRSTRPHIDVDLWETDTAVALNAIREGRADFGLVRTDRVQAPLRLRHVRSDRFMVAIPEGHPLTRKRVVEIGMLREWPVCVTRRSVSPIFHDNVMRLLLDHDAMPEKLVEASSLLAQLGVVACGLAGALVPMSTMRLRMPGVVFRDLKESSTVIDLSTVWNEENRSLLIDAFLDSIDVAMAASPQRAAWEKS